MVATKVIRIIAVGVTALFGLMGALFIAGEGLTDPGGWKGVALVASWGVPMAVLVLLALLRPEIASRVLPWALAVVGVLVLVDASTGVLEHGGPVSTVAMFVVAIPCGLLGLHKAGEAGLLVLGAASLQLLAAVAQHARRADDSGPSLAHALGGSSGVLVAPLLVCATLLLLTAALEGRAGRHGHLHAAR